MGCHSDRPQASLVLPLRADFRPHGRLVIDTVQDPRPKSAHRVRGVGMVPSADPAVGGCLQDEPARRAPRRWCGARVGLRRNSGWTPENAVPDTCWSAANRHASEPDAPSERLSTVSVDCAAPSKAGRIVGVSGPGGLDALETWLQDGYDQSFRTACLILGNRSDAEEAVQEAFLRAWRFRASLATGADVRPWLYRVVVNTCNSKLRKEIPHRDHRAADEQLDGLPATGDVYEHLDGASDLLTALQSLPAHLRVVIVLRYFADLSERELATAIGKRPGTVKSRLHEARRLLAEHPALRSESPPSTSEMQP